MTIKPEKLPAHATTSWPVAKAKARLSELIDRAIADGPQTITRNKRDAVVVVAANDWALTRKRDGNLADFFASSPLRDADVNLERGKDCEAVLDL